MPSEKREPISKLDIVLTLVKRAKSNKLEYGWVGADSFYERDRKFQNALNEMGEIFVLDVPSAHDPKPHLPKPAKAGRTPARFKSKLDSLYYNKE